MSSHFKFRSLAFYGVAIGFVLLLFRVVTAYGEANLKAPPSVDARYRLSYSPKPNCPKPNALVLNVAQSGIYLNGSLLPVDIDAQQAKASEKKPSLTGQLNNQQLNLTGTVPSSTLCNNLASPAEAHSASRVSIQSQVEGANLKGQITVSGIPEAVEFTALREPPVQPSEKSTSH